ncbi:DNA primase catalytic core [Mycoplasmoides fastidiosum]|uniref:DNA primase n=1 Tax=Mycoplasmoides fastidiosum TaxID=92758 RepID=A0ABU0LZQ9_9BACT|nr:DNA primase [Mycoplasmoides fastidiosum]MDQ0514172.1 DNA primase catalytic core [Mycoplasmoides fastidiosum]UUD37415.1 DNA primase [Mycoplasmoides fastidiosum]
MNFNNDLRNRVKVLNVVQKYVSLKKHGTNHLGLCPFHSDNAPSMNVSETKNIFKCFSCGVGGDGVSFLMKHLKINYRDALVQALELSGIDQTEYQFLLNKRNENPFEKLLNLNDFVAQQYIEFLDSNQEVKNYLIKVRQMDPKILETFKIGFAPQFPDRQSVLERLINSNNENNSYSYKIEELAELKLINLYNDKVNDFFSDRIIFPISNKDDRVIGFSGRIYKTNSHLPKYLNSSESVVFKKHEILYNLNNFYKSNQKYDEIILVEGFMDVIAFYKINVFNVVASMGTSFSNQQIKALSDYLEKKSQQPKKIVIAFDNDQAGKNFSEKTAFTFLEKGFEVRIIDFSQLQSSDKVLKDIDDIINDNNPVNIHLLKNPVNFFQYYLQQIKHQENFTVDDAVSACDNFLEYLFQISTNEIRFKNLVSLHYAEETIESIYDIFKMFNNPILQEQKNHQKAAFLKALYDTNSYLKPKNVFINSISTPNIVSVNEEFQDSYEQLWEPQELNSRISPRILQKKLPKKNNHYPYLSIQKYTKILFLLLINNWNSFSQEVLEDKLDCEINLKEFQDPVANLYANIYVRNLLMDPANELDPLTIVNKKQLDDYLDSDLSVITFGQKRVDFLKKLHFVRSDFLIFKHCNLEELSIPETLYNVFYDCLFNFLLCIIEIERQFFRTKIEKVFQKNGSIEEQMKLVTQYNQEITSLFQKELEIRRKIDTTINNQIFRKQKKS